MSPIPMMPISTALSPALPAVIGCFAEGPSMVGGEGSEGEGGSAPTLVSPDSRLTGAQDQHSLRRLATQPRPTTATGPASVPLQLAVTCSLAVSGC